MKNNGLFSTLYIDEVKKKTTLDDSAKSRMVALSQNWQSSDQSSTDNMWNSFLKQALGNLEFICGSKLSHEDPVYKLHEDWNMSEGNVISLVYIVDSAADIDDTRVGCYWPSKLISVLNERKLNWGILTNGALWRLYSLKSSKSYEDYVELDLTAALESHDEAEYALFERFFHVDSFLPEGDKDQKDDDARALGVYRCRLDKDKDESEEVLQKLVKTPLLVQVDEVLQYICNGFIADTHRSGEEYSEEERRDIFESAVKLLYRCLFLFYAEARRLLPSEKSKEQDYYDELSIRHLCEEARKFKWNERTDNESYHLWNHLKGLVNAVNEGDPAYGIMGYNGGLFDDDEEMFLGQHQLRNDFLARALYLMAYVEPSGKQTKDDEYPIPFEDLQVRHLGELYENILEFNVILADADRIRRRTKDGFQILLLSENEKRNDDHIIRKGQVYFGQSANERKQSGSYYTPESLVGFLVEKSVVSPLRERFEGQYASRLNEFIDQAKSGVDSAIRRGALVEAERLITRFIDTRILKFKVCDPAMGSGHFLISAANRMTNLVVELFAKLPMDVATASGQTSQPNYWRRLITRNCIYGVDLNSLAVNLGKLSLWLNCFATEHKLTFLDHRIRTGNSLIGIRSLDCLKSVPKRKKDKKSDEKGLLVDFDDFGKEMDQAARSVAELTTIDEDDTDRQKSIYDEARERSLQTFAPLADLYTAYLMDDDISSDTYHSLFIELATGKRVGTALLEEDLDKVKDVVEKLRKRHNFFHWELEFPDVFNDKKSKGFDATVGNPPWDAVKPKLDEFFLPYILDIQSKKRKEKDKLIAYIIGNNPDIGKRWNAYCDYIKEQSSFYKEEVAFSYLGDGDINTYKLFVEKNYDVCSPYAAIGIVLPSAFCTDKGSAPIRRLVLDSCRLDFMYCFENQKPTIFTAVHPNTKVVVAKFTKGMSSDVFSCAFMKHDPETLPAVEKTPIKMSRTDVLKFSPDAFNIMEFESQKDIDVTNSVYGDRPLLACKESGWHVTLSRELDMTNDQNLFIDQKNAEEMGLVSLEYGFWLKRNVYKDTLDHSARFSSGIQSAVHNPKGVYIPLVEGKNTFVFDVEYSATFYMVDLEKALRANQQKRSTSLLHPKLVYRSTGQSGNERNLIVSILPPGRFTGNSLNYVSWVKGSFEDKDTVLLAALMSSFVLDFVLRIKIDKNLNQPFIYSLPVPLREFPPIYSQALSARVLRLTCTHLAYHELWKEIFKDDWKSSTFWYFGANNFNYGPTGEQEIRQRLVEEARNLTAEWTPVCGVHERTADRRDDGDRAQLRAEIDAYVAHLYGLSRDDFAYILDTFQVLKRKEKAIFGEFKSKRKCLEEYDRIASSK